VLQATESNAMFRKLQNFVPNFTMCRYDEHTISAAVLQEQNILRQQLDDIIVNANPQTEQSRTNKAEDENNIAKYSTTTIILWKEAKHQ